MGRERIEISYIKDSRVRAERFKKRKFGLVKKAIELSILTGCEVALVIFGPDGKLTQYSSGVCQRRESGDKNGDPPEFSGDIHELLNKFVDSKEADEAYHNGSYDNSFKRRGEDDDAPSPPPPEVKEERPPRSQQQQQQRRMPPNPAQMGGALASRHMMHPMMNLPIMPQMQMPPISLKAGGLVRTPSEIMAEQTVKDESENDETRKRRRLEVDIPEGGGDGTKQVPEEIQQTNMPRMQRNGSFTGFSLDMPSISMSPGTFMPPVYPMGSQELGDSQPSTPLSVSGFFRNSPMPSPSATSETGFRRMDSGFGLSGSGLEDPDKPPGGK